MTKRIREPRKRTRTVQIKFWATPEEKELIEKKMALTGIVHMGAYLRKMAIDGYVVNLEIQEFKEIIRLLGIANNNINQIAHKFNATGRIYDADLEEVRTRIDGLYDEARKILTVIETSPQFYGWLCGLGKGVRVMSPPEVVEEMGNYVKGIAEMY